jgi:hypothetical protein
MNYFVYLSSIFTCLVSLLLSDICKITGSRANYSHVILEEEASASTVQLRA